MFLVKRLYHGTPFRDNEVFNTRQVGPDLTDAVVVEITKPHPDAQYQFSDWYGRAVWVTWLLDTDGPVDLDLG